MYQEQFSLDPMDPIRLTLSLSGKPQGIKKLSLALPSLARQGSSSIWYWTTTPSKEPTSLSLTLVCVDPREMLHLLKRLYELAGLG